METVTLGRAKEIAEVLNSFTGEPEYNELVAYARKKVGATAHEVSMVLTFIKDFQPVEIVSSDIDLEAKIDVIANQPINLASELQYNYAVAKVLLQFIVSKNSLPDGEEIRKTLREISRFSDAMLKMQERVYNVQEMQKFQDRVLEVLTEDQQTLLLDMDI
ncbi:hypothetical protein DRN75_01805 [Nanoarchaeota archaeon]|nr:MAG: hypothetical protein DRN75_01805 [Nanoarchaeota archaeon]